MSWETELAKHFKSLGKGKTPPIVIGEVLSVSPLKISILSGAAIVSENMLYRCKLLTEDNRIVTGDKVLCLALDNYKTFVVIDKVVK